MSTPSNVQSKPNKNEMHVYSELKALIVMKFLALKPSHPYPHGNTVYATVAQNSRSRAKITIFKKAPMALILPKNNQ